MPPFNITVIASRNLLNGYFQSELAISAGISPQPGQYLHCRSADGKSLNLPLIGSAGKTTVKVLGYGHQIPVAGSRLEDGQLLGTALAVEDTEQLIVACEDTALACALFAVERCRHRPHITPTVFAQFDSGAPFRPAPSQILLPDCPPGVIAAVPLLDDWNIASRLASTAERSGFYHGQLCELLDYCYGNSPQTAEHRIKLLACGSQAFTEELAKWCESRDIKIQASHIPQQETDAETRRRRD